MKVAYNTCYGGFGLSPKAETEYMKRKGVELFWYERFTKNNNKLTVRRMTSPPEEDCYLSYTASIKDLGEIIPLHSISNEFYHYNTFSSYDLDSRCDPDLIDVIEEMGDKANGECADISIEEIPDGADFEITEYDGREEIRQLW